MLYLSGVVREGVQEIGAGFMVTRRMGNVIPAGALWAADTGCFRNPDGFDLEAYLAWLRRQDPETCLFATAPDVVGDHAETLRRSIPVLPLIREAGYRAAFVAQDGATAGSIPWDECDALFIGGTTEWKLSEAAYGLVHAARKRGKWVHVGRVNSFRRMRAFAAAGADSADGTFIAFAPKENVRRLQRWIRSLEDNPHLFTAAGSQ